MKTICCTGHRPPKLFGYDLNAEGYINLKRQIKDILISEGCTEAISGMALGADTIFALAVLELKEEGHDIKLHCAIPCKNYTSKWVHASVRMFEDIISKADKVVYVSEEDYTENCLANRNYYMVDNSDEVIAIWDGSWGSGTGHTVGYTRYKKKPIHEIKVVRNVN